LREQKREDDLRKLSGPPPALQPDNQP